MRCQVGSDYPPRLARQRSYAKAADHFVCTGRNTWNWVSSSLYNH